MSNHKVYKKKITLQEPSRGQVLKSNLFQATLLFVYKELKRIFFDAVILFLRYCEITQLWLLHHFQVLDELKLLFLIISRKLV